MPLFWYRTTKSSKVATFRDEIDPSFSIVPRIIFGLSTMNIKYLLKVGAVTGSVAAELLDAPDPFLLLLTVVTS
jgi:hypothetical protein